MILTYYSFNNDSTVSKYENGTSVVWNPQTWKMELNYLQALFNSLIYSTISIAGPSGIQGAPLLASGTNLLCFQDFKVLFTNETPLLNPSKVLNEFLCAPACDRWWLHS